MALPLRLARARSSRSVAEPPLLVQGERLAAGSADARKSRTGFCWAVPVADETTKHCLAQEAAGSVLRASASAIALWTCPVSVSTKAGQVQRGRTQEQRCASPTGPPASPAGTETSPSRVAEPVEASNE